MDKSKEIIVHVPTLEIWKRVVAVAKEKGMIYHVSPDRYTSYGEDSAVGLSRNQFCSKSWYLEHKYPVISAEEFFRQMGIDSVNNNYQIF